MNASKRLRRSRAPLAVLCGLAFVFVASATGSLVTSSGLAAAGEFVRDKTAPVENPKEVALPEPSKSGQISVEGAIAARRSVREYGDDPVLLSQLSQILWAAQGITGERGFKRAAPSAGAKYPLEIFVAIGNVERLAPGLYRYKPETHSLSVARTGDVRRELCSEALSQECVRGAPLDVVIAADYERTMEKYGDRGVRYVHMEVGAVAENIYLQAESLGLGTVFVGAFSDGGVKKLLGVDDVEPLGIMPVGVRR
jgi:SagB-type dehydrogenase family enzyme